MFPLFKQHGILGLNARNLLFIKPFNPKRAVAFADDKLRTKMYLAARGVPTAKIYARIETREQLRSFDFSSLPDSCVLKPNHGFGGEGIIVLKGRQDGVFLEQGRNPITEEELRAHIEDILDGKFSITGIQDTAFFEEILTPHECFAPFRPIGLPDIRVIVFNLVPVMAMLRVGTAASHGKGNIHLGAIGIGIDIAKGVTTHAAQYHRIITELPHGGSLSGHRIPFWEEILLISSQIQKITNIGYLATDITIDSDKGPTLLEVNARAGLMVQIANLAPLRSRLERLEGLRVSSPEKGVRIGQDLFGEKVRRRRLTEEKPTLGLREVILIAGDGMSMEVPCLISPEEERTVFAGNLITELKAQGALEEVEGEEQSFRVKFTLAGRKLQTVISEGEVPSASARAVIGKRDLTGFLIDPSKESAPSLIRPAVREDLRASDRLLARLDRQLSLLKELKPRNLLEELRHLRRDASANPFFLYHPLPEDFRDIEEKLGKLTCDPTSPFGVLLEKKRRELLARCALLRARGDDVRFTQASLALYGGPTVALRAVAEARLRGRTACDLPPHEEELRTPEDACTLFQEALDRYGLHEWRISIRERLVADCSIGRKTLYLRAGARFGKTHIASLIAHEVETHILTAENGSHQPFELFRRGFANYIDTQEGLAIFNQNRVLSPHSEKRYIAVKGVLALAYGLEHSFSELRSYLTKELGYESPKALMTAVGLKRGLSDTSRPGAFTKGVVYFRGLRAIEEFVSQGGDLRRLYIGKVALEDLELAEKVPGVKPPLILPTSLSQGWEAR